MDEKEKIDELLMLLEQELTFTFSRSSGPGGQHANKVNTRVELRFPVTDSQVLTEQQKDQLHDKLGHRISSDGLLILSAQDERSQSRNRQQVLARFRELITETLRRRKKRIPTKPPLVSDENRLTEKKKTSEKKQFRRKPDDGTL
jgi:ribosome-associated protein